MKTIAKVELTDDCPLDYFPLYWDNKGKYNELYDKYWALLIPSHGSPMDSDGHVLIHAELLRKISSVNYDLYNNGLCNDRVEEIEYLMDNLKYYAPYFENIEEANNFEDFCDFYLEEKQRESEHESSEYENCLRCDGGERDCGVDEDGENITETCDVCDGSGEIEVYNELVHTDWLGEYFTPSRMRTFDRAIDAIILYVDAVEKGTQEQ